MVVRKKHIFDQTPDKPGGETGPPGQPISDLDKREQWMDSFRFGSAKRAKLERWGDWWFAHSYLIWVLAGTVWIAIALAAVFSHSPRLIWVCAFVAFLHYYRGWEIYKQIKVTKKTTERLKRLHEDNKD